MKPSPAPFLQLAHSHPSTQYRRLFTHLLPLPGQYHVGAALGGKPEPMPAPRVGAKGLSVCLSVRPPVGPRTPAERRSGAQQQPRLHCSQHLHLNCCLLPAARLGEKKKVKTDPKPLCRALSVVSGLQTFPWYGKTSGKPIPLGPAGERRCQASMGVSQGCKRVPENRRAAPKRWISAISDLFADFSSLWPRVVMCSPGGQPWLHLPAPGSIHTHAGAVPGAVSAAQPSRGRN